MVNRIRLNTFKWHLHAVRNAGMIMLICLSAGHLAAQCPPSGCTTTISGADSGTYTANPGNKICFTATANFTGTINLYGGTLVNCATAAQTFTLNTTSSFPNGILDNHGQIDFPASYNFKDGITVNNYGTLNLAVNMDIRSNAKIHNFGTIDVVGNLVVQALLDNQGTFTIGGAITANSSSNIMNTDYLSANSFTTNNLWNNSGTFMISTSCTLNSTSSGTIDGGCVHCNTFSCGGTVTAISCGTITVQTTSTLSSSGSFIGPLAFVDLTPPAMPPFIDTSSGFVDPLVTWTACTSCPPEICDNSIDDDGDGQIDCADSDCCCPQAPVLTKQ